MITREEMILVTEWVNQCGGDFADIDSCLVNAPDGMTLGRAFFVLYYLAEYVWYQGHLEDLNSRAFGPIDTLPEDQYSDVFHQIKLAKQSLEGIPGWLLEGARQDGSDYGSKK